ncbi:MAG: ABC transporter ATP-binding protein [Gammaproteobacteria bacterium]
MNEPVLQADKLSVSRGGKTVLDQVSFAVTQGSVFALLGGNGAGKSTTLLTFLGFLSPSSGSARVMSVDASADQATVRKSIAYLPETATLYEHLNAYENLRYLIALSASTATTEQIESALDRVALDRSARSKKLRSYSKGMRQKVAIALALLRDTRILLLDEPTSGLDPVAIDEFHALIGDLSAQGKTVLMVTHDVYGACQIADRIGLLRKGAFVGEFHAPADGRIDPEVVHRAFAQRAA